MSAHETTATEYINHHLSFQTREIFGFAVNVDTLVTRTWPSDKPTARVQKL